MIMSGTIGIIEPSKVMTHGVYGDEDPLGYLQRPAPEERLEGDYDLAV
jgi:hypothetical protein